jgi:hypothetical protein
MKTKEAINRLTYTIGKGNKPNETDKVALNSIITYVNKFEQETIQDNLLFAKLYTLVLKDFVNTYKDIDFANIQLNKELSTPLNAHIELLLMTLKTTELDAFFKQNGIVDPFIIGKPISEAVEKYEQNKQLFPKIDTKKMLEVMDMWDFENVSAHLNRNINESLNTYKNV